MTVEEAEGRSWQGESALRMTQYSVEHAADAAYWMTADGRIRYANETACRSLGYSKEELLRMSVDEVDPGMPKEKWAAHWRRVAARGRVTIETVHRRRDGTEFPVEIRISHQRFEGGDYQFALARDITSRQQTEREMDYQDAFRHLITRISARFINISPDEIDSELELALAEVGEFTRVDRSYIFRLTPDGEGMAVVAEWCREGVARETRRLEGFRLERAAWWLDRMRRNEVFHLTNLDGIPAEETCLRRALESLGHRSLVEVPILQRGTMVGYLGLATVESETEWSGSTISVLRILADIAANAFARRQAEEERLRLATAAQQTAESVLITDDEGRIQYVNPAFERATGQLRKEVVGQTLRDLYGEVEGGALYHSLWARLTENHTWAGRVSRLRADGSALEEDVSITAIHDVHGQMLGYVVVGRDVTEQMRMEALLRQSQKMEAIGQLAGGVAHDFNNLLQAIKGYTALSRSVLDPGDQVHSYLAEVERASDRAGDLVRQLLTFSRHEAMKSEYLSVADVVAGVMKMLRRLIGEHLDLEIRSGSDSDLVFGDRGQIEQIIMNLCVNARDAMPDHGRITIETGVVSLDASHLEEHSWAKPGRFSCLTVSDTGCGMSEEVRERIFEPFYTTKGVGEGTGLGLATVYAIVERHEGLLRVESKPGQGTTFRIFLPVREPAPSEAEDEDLDEIAGGGTETILIAEDDRQVRKLAAQVLSGAGYRVIEASDGDEAIRLFHRHERSIDLALLDVVMPGCSGREVHDQIVRLRPQTSVLFSSGYSFNALSSGQVPEDGFDVITKPYKPGALLRRVREVLESDDRLIG
ncbi:MAG: PAS domain S-box protein [Planctomycetota bacterium]